MTTKKAKKATKRVGFWEVGEAYLIRTVTMAWLGRLVAIDAHELVLEDAGWVADTGRYSEVVAKGLSAGGQSVEFEAVPGRAVVGRGAIVDAIPWLHDLPRQVI